MKTLHIEGGARYYGGALQVVFLLRGLAARGDEAALVAPRGSAIARQAAPHAARVHEIAMHGEADAMLLPRLRALIRAERPDIVHLHSRHGVDLWGGLAARLEGVPAVHSRRVDNPEPRAWVAVKYRLFDRVVAISEGIRQVLLAEGLPPARVTRVHSAVDTDAYRPLPADRAWLRAQFGIAEGDPVVAMVAQFIARKGHRTLLAALPAVLAAQPATRVLLFGLGRLQAPLRREVEEAGLGEHVVFAGFRDDLARVLPSVDLVVHPAEREGLGVALLQAAACGVPIVAARAGGIPEVVRPGVNGELVAPGDAAGLAAAMLRLLGDAALRRRYGAAGRALVEAEFSIQAMVEGNLNVYHDVLRERTSPRRGADAGAR